MGVFNRVLNYLGLKEEEDGVDREMSSDEMDEAETNPFEQRKIKGNVVSIHSQKHIRVVLSEPRTYDDAQEIADNLRNRRPVIVNLHRARSDQAMRIVDFLSGTVYALSGSISKIGPSIFLCTPESVEIQGTIKELVEEDLQYN